MSEPHQNRLHRFIDVKLGTRELENYLLEAIKLLQKNVDINEYKQYIFGLFFLKRLNDVFDEENDAIVAEKKEKSINFNASIEHEYFIPKTVQWRRLNANNLHKACKEIERHNPQLTGVFSGLGFNISERNVTRAINLLLKHFSSIRLRDSDLVDTLVLPRVYQSIIQHLAVLAGKRGSDFSTPIKINKLLVALLNPSKDMWICDPTAGTGGILVECINYLGTSDPHLENLFLYGQEKDVRNWAICKMNLLLHSISTAHIEKGDIIRDPRLIKDDHLLLFDLIAAHPPFLQKQWGVEAAEKDPYDRFKFGIPSNNFGDMAFLQHMIVTLRPNGRLGVILPTGVLFRGGKEKEIRKAIIEQDLIESIISLPPNVLHGSSVSACIIIINKAKSRERRGRILFIDAFNLYNEARPEDSLSKEHFNEILNTFKRFETTEKLSRVVTLKEIIPFSYNLNIPLYIDNTPEEEVIDISMTTAGLLHYEMERQHISQKVQEIIQELDSSMTGLSNELPSTWFRIRLSELVDLMIGIKEKQNQISGGTVRFIRGKDIREFGRIEWESISSFIPEKQYEKMVKGKIRIQDILVVRSGLETGKIAYIRELPFPKATINDELIIIRTKDPEMLDQQYLYYLLSSKICQNQIRKRFHGVGGGISRSDFLTIQVPLPPISEQRKLANICAVVDEALLKTEKVVIETDKLKQGLMQQLLTGKRQIK